MTNPTPLSPAAQAVLDAANGAGCYGPDDVLNDSRWIAAAALRAAADQVVPEADAIRSPCREHCAIGSFAERVRHQLFAIAAELDGTQPSSENVQ